MAVRFSSSSPPLAPPLNPATNPRILIPKSLIFSKIGINQRIRSLTVARVSTEPDLLAREDPNTASDSSDYGVVSIHHVGVLCENLEKSLDFYQNILGLKINEARPHDKLPYRGAWLWVGDEMIHLMELPNPDPLTGRPEHGGRDRHACIAIKNVAKLKEIFDKAEDTERRASLSEDFTHLVGDGFRKFVGGREMTYPAKRGASPVNFVRLSPLLGKVAHWKLNARSAMVLEMLMMV